jgi:hypothetical protein
VKRDPRGQGDRGETIAASWFAERGATVYMPFFHTSPLFDFIVDWELGVQRIQVKTSSVLRRERWDITVCTRGGNRSWSGLVKRLDASHYDWLFVVVGDGRRWLIRPQTSMEGAASASAGRSTNALRSTPACRSQDGLVARLRDPWAGFRSGQTDETVNLAAQPSQVRILPPPSAEEIYALCLSHPRGSPTRRPCRR